MVFSRSKNTSPERRVFKYLRRRGYRVEKHIKSLPGTPDIVLPDLRVVIFIHGCFWHHHDCGRGRLPQSNRHAWKEEFNRKKARDIKNFKKLKKLGWHVVVIWECETYSLNIIERKLSF